MLAGAALAGVALGVLFLWTRPNRQRVVRQPGGWQRVDRCIQSFDRLDEGEVVITEEVREDQEEFQESFNAAVRGRRARRR